MNAESASVVPDAPIPGTSGSPLVVSDEMWTASGQILIPSDLPLGRSVSGHNGADEVFIVSASRDPSRVQRNVKSTTARFEPGFGWITTADCEWVGNEPFAVLVHKTVRQPAGSKPQPARKMELAIYWSQQSLAGGEINKFIAIASLPTVKAGVMERYPLEWVRFDILSEATGIHPVELTRGFLSLKIMNDHRQPSWVHAESEAALVNGEFIKYPAVEGTSAHRLTSFPSGNKNSEVPHEEVWVAWPSAVNVLRLISLGVKEHHDLFPTHFI